MGYVPAMGSKRGILQSDWPTAALVAGVPLLAGAMLGANQTRAGAFMPWLASIGYWIAISLITWCLLAAMTWLLERLLRPWDPPQLFIWLAGAIAGSFAARPAIYATADLFRPIMRAPMLREMRPFSFDVEFLTYYLTNWSLVIFLWISGCALVAHWRGASPASGRVELPADDRLPSLESARSQHGFVRKLPPLIGRDILALQAEDHYVRVHTASGDALILASLSDAIDDVLSAGYAGQRTHRSWWVAQDAVTAQTRRGRQLVLVLKNGIEAPVSLSYRQLAQANGLLSA